MALTIGNSLLVLRAVRLLEPSSSRSRSLFVEPRFCSCQSSPAIERKLSIAGFFTLRRSAGARLCFSPQGWRRYLAAKA